MSIFAANLLAKLYPTNPYADFPYQQYPLDLQGGDAHPLFGELIQRLRPQLIIEVGCWKGGTAIQMAAILKQLALDAAVLCVDTWLGSVEHLTGAVKGWDIRPYLRHGYPGLYHQFLANVMHRGCQDVIVPLANTSANAARWLRRQQIVADLIYVDGSHEEDDVYQDVSLYWRVLRPGGVMFGDDFHAYWHGVICAVNRFANERDLAFRVTDQKWLLRKPE